MPADPDIVETALRITGMSQSGLARLLAVDPATVWRWRNGMGIDPLRARIMRRIGESSPEVARSIYTLSADGRLDVALAVAMGAPAPVHREAA